MSRVDVNEIIVKAEQTPGQVCFHNFDELKDLMQKGLSVYRTTEYTVENIDQAEQDMKELKAIKKKLTDKKKELESAYSLPIEEVKKQLDELINMVKEPLDLLDKMVKENAKKAKEEEILSYAKEKLKVLGNHSEQILQSRAFFNQRWLNATYKKKDWQGDIDKIVKDAVDAIGTIESVGGGNKSALLGFYYDRLSMDGADKFLKVVKADIDTTPIVAEEEEDAANGYKVIKVYGTERQMRQLMTQLSLSEMEFEELEDGMPKNMEELTDADFDSFVAFDIEHTGTFGINNGDSESEIIEIGAVKVRDGQIVDRFDMLANPGRKIVPMIARITNITDDMVKDEPPVDEVVRRFKEFVGEDILIGHNIKGCDIPHIARAAKRAGISFDNKYLDTKPLAKTLQSKKGWKNVKLTYLSEYYHVEQSEAHRAWCDAEANAYVYLKLKQEII